MCGLSNFKGMDKISPSTSGRWGVGLCYICSKPGGFLGLNFKRTLHAQFIIFPDFL